LFDSKASQQPDRVKIALQKLLEMYVRKEFLPWTKKFPDVFYEELFRLRGWPYDPTTIKRPHLVGKLTNQLVYEKLPKGVLIELKQTTPKSKAGNYTKRLHQGLTEEIGNPHLERHLASVITLMRVSSSWPKFMRNFVRAFGGQEQLPFNEGD